MRPFLRTTEGDAPNLWQAADTWNEILETRVVNDKYGNKRKYGDGRDEEIAAQYAMNAAIKSKPKKPLKSGAWRRQQRRKERKIEDAKNPRPPGISISLKDMPPIDLDADVYLNL